MSMAYHLRDISAWTTVINYLKTSFFRDDYLNTTKNFAGNFIATATSEFSLSSRERCHGYQGRSSLCCQSETEDERIISALMWAD